MPALGADMESGTVLEWFVHAGDTVHRGDLVAVVHTDKADIEVEIFEDGVIGELLVPVGEEVDVGTPLARLESARSATSAAPQPEQPPPEPQPPEPQPPEPQPPEPQPPEQRPRGARVEVSPYARRRAVELGVDLATLEPSEAGRPITIADVEKAAAPTSRREPVDQATAMRRAIGNLMARSKREIPHYYLDHDIELGHTLAWLRARNESVPIDQRILPAALFCRAVAIAAARMPELNGFWRGDHFEPGNGVHLGVAIALRGGGLVAPAIRNADQLALPDLMSGLRDLSGRARGGRLHGSEMTDATITVTNLGDQGVRAVYGVIYPPQVALVGFGKVAERVWAAEETIGVRPVVSATLAADHRATDGHVGARFLALVERLLHRPEEL
jgi:pyruvate dehydrogenase E2 component (dihydrolipoamide acetyltransferase)